MEHLVHLSGGWQFPVCGPCILGVGIGVPQGDEFRGQTGREILVQCQFLPGGRVIDVPDCEPYVVTCPE